MDGEQQEETETLEKLMARFTLCRLCIKTVSEVDPSDPRRAPALEEYNRQLATISKRIENLTGKPPAITVGLKPAVLFPKAQGVSNDL